MFDSITIANRILARARERGDQLTPMQLIKLVYIAHGWTLGLLGRPLIRDDIQAWQYGPVIPHLYNKVRTYKSNPVSGPIESGERKEDIPTAEASIVDQVYAIYGDKSGPALSRLTHQVGSPWHVTYKRGSFGLVIPNDIIEDHYSRLASSRGSSSGAGH